MLKRLQESREINYTGPTRGSIGVTVIMVQLLYREIIIYDIQKNSCIHFYRIRNQRNMNRDKNSENEAPL